MTYVKKYLLMTAAAVGLAVLPAWAADKETPFWERRTPETASAPADQTASAPEPVDPLKDAEVAVADLLQAGFSDPVAVQPSTSLFKLPTYYFRVKERSTEPAWGETPNDAANLVAVLARPLQEEEAQGLKAGEIAYQESFGRFQARTYRNGRYLVVTGPDGDKVANLIKLLEKKKFR
jgi:hypothetical protein